MEKQSEVHHGVNSGGPPSSVNFLLLIMMLCHASHPGKPGPGHTGVLLFLKLSGQSGKNM